MIFQAYCRGQAVHETQLLQWLVLDSPGLFETLRVYDGHIFCEEEHLERLEASARSTGSKIPWSRAKIRQELRLALRASRLTDAVLRITFCGEHGFVLAGIRARRLQLWREGVAIRTASEIRPQPKAGPSSAKTGDYLASVMAGLGVPDSAATYEWLSLDARKYVAETRIGNIFLISKNGKKTELWTPPSGSILNGVTRRFVIECASQLKIPVRETFFSRHELFNAREVFLTNTSWEILPVRELDGRRIAAGHPGKLTQALHREFRRKVKIQCQKQKKPGAH